MMAKWYEAREDSPVRRTCGSLLRAEIRDSKRPPPRSTVWCQRGPDTTETQWIPAFAGMTESLLLPEGGPEHVGNERAQARYPGAPSFMKAVL